MTPHIHTLPATADVFSSVGGLDNDLMARHTDLLPTNFVFWVKLVTGSSF